MNKLLNRFTKIWLALVYVILFLPIAVLILMSFNNSKYQTLPIDFSFKWYIKLFTESNLFPSTWLSVELSFFVALAAIFLGILTAVGMRNMNKKRLAAFSGLLTVPVIFPWLVLATSLLILFNAVGIGRSFVGMFFGNLVVVIPYAVLPIFARMSSQELSCEDAARTLGASPLRVLFDVTLPNSFPAILAGGLMAFVVCFNNFVLQFYLAPFGVRTLPLEIYSAVRVGCEPDMNALAALIILFTAIPLVIIYKLGYSTKLFKTR